MMKKLGDERIGGGGREIYIHFLNVLTCVVIITATYPQEFTGQASTETLTKRNSSPTSPFLFYAKPANAIGPRLRDCPAQSPGRLSLAKRIQTEFDALTG